MDALYYTSSNTTTDWDTTDPSNHSLIPGTGVSYADPEILALLALGSVGFILNITIISLASRRPAFTQVPVRSLVISLGSANLYVIFFCMFINAAWHSIGGWFDGDCRFYRTVEAFSINAGAYIAVAWAVDRCRSCVVQKPEKNALGTPVKKPRHLTKLVIAAWALAVLLALQHLVVVPSEVSQVDVNHTVPVRVPATMDCVSRGHYYPPWKQIVVDMVSISTTFLIPVFFIVCCLVALLVHYIRLKRNKTERPRTKLGVRRFHSSFDDEAVLDNRHIVRLTVALALAFIVFWGSYYTVLIIKVVGWIDVSLAITSILYMIGLGYSLASPIIYLSFHLWRTAYCGKDAYGLERSASTIRERIEMLHKNQLSRRFDDL
ncbi:gonadotropin-releasing hormone II receptor-like [Paramacrobiotus metropolitanus]|uniref:gonadotropin-releasing hormone II receptor-like n=1 Tax=Paramacrobiotus metropolitanus TaxID=2943436 RepID=UPI002445A14A|nr:gonadotropin-releasing hormone II receptor-like [Paramacrobiotus metropolitanus]